MIWALEVFLVAIAFFGAMELIGKATRCKCEHCRLDFPRDEMRRALSSAPTVGLETSLRSVPDPSTRIPRVSDERTLGLLSTSWSQGSTADASPVAARRVGPARPFRPGTAR